MERAGVLELNSTHTIMRNASLAMLGTAFNLVCFLIAGIVIARYLGTELFGVYSFAVSTSLVFTALSNGGLRGLMIILIREVARDQQKAGAYLGSVLLINLALTVFTLVLLPPIVTMMGLSPLKVKAVYIAILANLIQIYGRLAIATFRAFERMAYEGVLLVLQGLAFLVLVLAAIYTKANVLTILVALLTSYILMTWSGYFLVSKHLIRPTFRMDISLWKFLVKEAAPIGVAFFLMTPYDRIGAIALEAFRGSSEVGLFSTAFSLTRNFTFIPFVFTGAILPIFSRIAISSRQELSLAYAKAFKLLLIIGLPLAVGSTLLAKPIILLIYGVEFAEASIALQVVAWSIPVFFLSFATKTALEAINKQTLWTIAIAIGMLVHLVLNIALVPQMGVLGASLALLSADIMIFGVTFYFVSRELHPPIVAITVGPLKGLVSAALLGAAVYYFKSHNLFLLVLLGAVVYGSSLILMRVFDSQEIALVKDAVRLDKFASWLVARLSITLERKKA